jgi:hypothetical protein
MRHIKLLGTALMMFFALSALATATASAEEPTKILPEPTVAAPLTFTSTSTAGLLLTLGGKKVECTKDTGSGEFTTPNLGKYKVLFEGCKGEFGTTCTGVGDKSGTILQEGALHYVLALLSGILVAALVGLPKEFHFTCEVIGLKILVLVLGCIAALAEPLETLAKTTKDIFEFSAVNSGDPDIQKILMEEAKEEIACVLSSSINGGEFESSALKGTATNEGFKKGGKAVEVLLMNKKM